MVNDHLELVPDLRSGKAGVVQPVPAGGRRAGLGQAEQIFQSRASAKVGTQILR